MSVYIAIDAQSQQLAHYAKMDTLILHAVFAQQVSIFQITHHLRVVPAHKLFLFVYNVLMQLIALVVKQAILVIYVTHALQAIKILIVVFVF